MKGVFQTKISPGYDDLPERWYHFPRRYLNQVKDTVGDWIVYYEPRRATSDVRSRGGRQSYFALARVDNIRSDDTLQNHFYADVSSFLQFDNPVPFREGENFFESALRSRDGRTNQGSARRAVRNMPDNEFDLIVRAGFSVEIEQTQSTTNLAGFEENQQPIERPIVETTIRRAFRDRTFSQQIQTIYDKRCAITGLKLINGGGRAETQSAHIMPVAANGPDSVRNGLALSSTVHWMFDRGLISIDDDFNILQANRLVPEEIKRMFNENGEAFVPEDVRLRPHMHFLRYHRENIFKG